MPDADPPGAASDRPGPAAGGRIVPGTVLLRLRIQPPGGVLDGAWWPRSRNIEAELPGLVTVFVGRLGPVARVGLDASAWDGAPLRVVVDGSVVHLDWSPIGDDTVMVTLGDDRHFALLLVPPHATKAAAEAAMARAVHADNAAQADRILLDAAIPPDEPPRP